MSQMGNLYLHKMTAGQNELRPTCCYRTVWMRVKLPSETKHYLLLLCTSGLTHLNRVICFSSLLCKSGLTNRLCKEDIYKVIVAVVVVLYEQSK